MTFRAARIDTSMSASFITSAVIHLAVFLLLLWWGQLFAPQMAIQETYYVDVVNMPTATPQVGDSEQKVAEAAAVPASDPQPLPVAPLPTKQKTGTKFVKPAARQESAESEAAFAERMAKLSGKAEAQQYEEKLKRISSRAKAGSNSKIGAPTANGTEAGSRYGDYIKSRLEDALKVTSYSTTKNPEVAVRMTISAEGRLLRMKIERSSGDAAFELAVRRAIDLASQKFTPPPGQAVYENGFLFKPKGISSGTRR